MENYKGHSIQYKSCYWWVNGLFAFKTEALAKEYIDGFPKDK